MSATTYGYTVKEVLFENPDGKNRRVSINEKSSTQEDMQTTCDSCGVWCFNGTGRRGNTRIPYMSARTVLDWKSEDNGFYTDIGDVIRQISSKPVEDLHELWRRIVFTILVSNTDDHLKNHGFLCVGNDRWRLSPAFDINPSPSRHRVMETGIVRGGSFDASLDSAIEACKFFDMALDEARQQANRMATSIAKNWKQALRNEGATSDNVKFYATAFEHADAEKTLGF